MGETQEPPTYRRISDAMQKVLESADHLVNEYTRNDKGHGTGVGMRAAEDRLIRDVQEWRRVCEALASDWPPPFKPENTEIVAHNDGRTWFARTKDLSWWLTALGWHPFRKDEPCPAKQWGTEEAARAALNESLTEVERENAR